MKLPFFLRQNLSRSKLVGLACSFICLLLWGFSLNATRASATVGTGSAASCTEAALNSAIAMGGVITFNCGSGPATIPITSRITISQNTTLDGTGQAITLDGNATAQNTTGLFVVNSNVTFTVKKLSLINAQSTENGAAILAGIQATLAVSDSTFNNNISTVTSPYEGGGAIFLGPNASGTITNSVFTYNKAPSGGAINSRDSAALTISSSTFQGNEATGSDGGAIYSHSDPSGSKPPMQFSLESSQVLSNSAKTQGGGISAAYLNAVQSGEVSDSKIGYNSAGTVTNSGSGGGIYLEQGQFTVSRAAIYNNAVPSRGGGIFIGTNIQVTAIVKIENTTIYNNQAYNGKGGGIFRNSGSLRVTNATIAGNFSSGEGGGFNPNPPQLAYDHPEESDVILSNTLITANTTASGDTFFYDCVTKVQDGGHNLQFTLNGPYAQACVNNITRGDPKLTFGLYNFGGPTPTLGLLAGSPAIDAIPTADCPLSEDQRGFARPYGTKCDIGAFEGVILPPSIALAFSPSTAGTGGTSSLIFTVANPSSPGTSISGITFKSDLPANLKVANESNLLANCAGPNGNPTVTFTNSNKIINIQNVSLAVGQTCTISVDVVNQLTAPGSLTARVELVSYLSTTSPVNAQATLSVVNSVPTGLAATAVNSSQIHLTWQSVPSNATGLRIERSLNGTANFQPVATLNASATSYDNTGLAEGSLYYYRLYATLPNGNSPYSNLANATTLLNAPSNLTATMNGSGINLSWQNNSTKQTSFQLERKVGPNGAYSLLASPTAANFSDTGQAGKIYYYRVKAVNATLASSYSNDFSLITPGGNVVTKPSENGSNGAGTLLWALNNTANGGSKTITFNLESGTTVNVANGVTLEVANGVTLGGGCGNGPAITISGAKLLLKGNVTLYGVRIKGSGLGPLISNRSESPSATFTGNYLSCVGVGP